LSLWDSVALTLKKLTWANLKTAPAAVFSPITRTLNAQTGTTYTLVLGDAGNIVTMSNAAANTLTIPPNSSVAFPVGTQIDIAQKGAGKTTLAAGAGVTINNTNKSLAAQYAGVTAVEEATDTWTLYGSTIA
jgi:DNA-binding IclR family transcriptional regulator